MISIEFRSSLPELDPLKVVSTVSQVMKTIGLLCPFLYKNLEYERRDVSLIFLIYSLDRYTSVKYPPLIPK